MLMKTCGQLASKIPRSNMQLEEVILTGTKEGIQETERAVAGKVKYRVTCRRGHAHEHRSTILEWWSWPIPSLLTLHS